MGRIDQVSTLYENISLTDTRMIPQYEKVLLNFTREVKIQSNEMERLALVAKRYLRITTVKSGDISAVILMATSVCRAQDQVAIQMSAMEEEMDQRIHTTAKNTRIEVGL